MSKPESDFFSQRDLFLLSQNSEFYFLHMATLYLTTSEFIIVNTSRNCVKTEVYFVPCGHCYMTNYYITVHGTHLISRLLIST